MITIDLYGDPIPLQRPRFRRMSKGVMTFDPQAKEKEQIRWQMRAQFRNEPLLNPILVDITFYMPIPKGTSRVRRKEMIAGNLHHMKRPDVDNLSKFILDCLNELVIRDDAQICELRARKVYAEKSGTLIKIVPLNIVQEVDHEDNPGSSR